MAELADGFLALPGGSGKLEEWFEVFTCSQLGYHSKPCGLLNVNHFFVIVKNKFKFLKQNYIIIFSN